MRVILLVLFIQCIAFCVQAERIIKREKYNLIIASDTVCAGEDYELTVDLKGQNGIVYRNGAPIPVNDNKGRVKFKAAASSYDINGRSKQSLKISIVMNEDSLFENVTYYVVNPPRSNEIRRVQDSLEIVLLRQEWYKEISYLHNYKRYFDGFAYKLGNDLLKNELGELLVLVVVDATGKVIKYDILKNTYKTIPLKKIQYAIESYQLKKDFVYDGNLKFSAVIYTVKGYRGNIILCSEH